MVLSLSFCAMSNRKIEEKSEEIRQEMARVLVTRHHGTGRKSSAKSSEKKNDAEVL